MRGISLLPCLSSLRLSFEEPAVKWHGLEQASVVVDLHAEHADCAPVQSEFSRRLEKAEHESRWKLDQQLASLSDANKAHLRQVWCCLLPCALMPAAF